MPQISTTCDRKLKSEIQSPLKSVCLNRIVIFYSFLLIFYLLLIVLFRPCFIKQKKGRGHLMETAVVVSTSQEEHLWSRGSVALAVRVAVAAAEKLRGLPRVVEVYLSVCRAPEPDDWLPLCQRVLESTWPGIRSAFQWRATEENGGGGPARAMVLAVAAGPTLTYLPSPRTSHAREGDLVVGVPSERGLNSDAWPCALRILNSVGLRYTDKSPWSSEGSIGDAMLLPMERPSPWTKWRAIATCHHKRLDTCSVEAALNALVPPHLKVVTEGLGKFWDWGQLCEHLCMWSSMSVTQMLQMFNCGISVVILVTPSYYVRIRSLLRPSELFLVGNVISIE